jgi:hypothetical protein
LLEREEANVESFNIAAASSGVNLLLPAATDCKPTDAFFMLTKNSFRLFMKVFPKTNFSKFMIDHGYKPVNFIKML